MANKRFTGYLRDPLGEYADYDLYRFTHISTTGEVIRGSTSYMRVGSDGFYDITIEYGTVSVYSRSDRGRRWISQGVVTINSDTSVTTLPALLLASVPVTPDIVLQLEAILSESEQAASDAEQSAIDAEQSAIDAENSAEVAMTAGWVYSDLSSGESERSDGDYFWLVSSDDSYVLELWEMGVSNATDTGKRTASYKSIDKLHGLMEASFTDPNLNPDISMDNIGVYNFTEYSSGSLGYSFVSNQKCTQIVDANCSYMIDRSLLPSNVISFSAKIQSTLAGTSTKRILIRQLDSGGAELTRETLNIPYLTDLTEALSLSAENVAIDPQCANVDFFFDAGVGGTINMNEVSISTSGGYRGSAVSQKQLEAVNNTVTNLDNQVTQLLLPEKPTYLGAINLLPAVFEGEGVKLTQIGNKVYVEYNDSDPAYNSPTKTTYYVDNANGSNLNSGLSPEAAIKSLNNLFTRFETTPPPSDVEIIVAAGIYDRDDSPSDSLWDYPHNISIRCDDGDVYFTSGNLADTYSWVEDGGAYKTARSVVYSCWDFKYIDGRGIPMFLAEANNLAECKNTAGTYYTNNVDVWIHTVDHREPDESTLVNLQVKPLVMVLNGGTTCVMKNANFLFTGWNNDDSLTITTSIGDSGFFKAENCSFCGSRTQNGLDANYTKTYLKNCTASYNGLDGFNYHDNLSLGGNQAFALEIDCQGYGNGTRRTGTNNGSTAHDGMKIIRVGCLYYDCYGPIIADVNGSYSFNINCVAAKSGLSGGNTSANFYFDDAAATSSGESWLVNCSGYDSDYDVSSDGTAKINVRGLDSSMAINSNTVIYKY